MDAWTFVLAILAGFGAGLLDSIVGGGGLIMTPAMVNLFPEWAILNIIATQRTSSIMGTSVAAWNYFRHVSLPWPLVLAACGAALPCSALGAMLARRTDPQLLKWSILAMCVLLAVYTFVRKDLGRHHEPRFEGRTQWMVAGLVGAATGFYNGLIGPGTGTLMVFAFVSVIGLDFLRASAVSKAANVAALDGPAARRLCALDRGAAADHRQHGRQPDRQPHGHPARQPLHPLGLPRRGLRADRQGGGRPDPRLSRRKMAAKPPHRRIPCCDTCWRRSAC